MKKKVISAILAGACALSSLSFSAAAAAAKDKELKTSGEITLKASVALATPTINVSVPSGISAVVNPYGVKVTVKDVEYGETGIASAKYMIKNYTKTSNILIEGVANLTVPYDKKAEKSDITVLDGQTGDITKTNIEKSTTKEMLAYVSAATATTQFTSDSPAETGSILKTVADYAKGKNLVFANATNAKKGEEPANSMNIMLLTAAKDDSSYSAGEFAIAGHLAKGTGVEWTAADKITLNLVLNITPTALTKI